jgi:hypothetical protein
VSELRGVSAADPSRLPVTPASAKGLPAALRALWADGYSALSAVKLQAQQTHSTQHEQHLANYTCLAWALDFFSQQV